MIQLLEQIPLDRALLVVFLAGQLWAQFKNVRASLKHQGERMGAAEKQLAEVLGRVAALEASRGRA